MMPDFSPFILPSVSKKAYFKLNIISVLASVVVFLFVITFSRSMFWFIFIPPMVSLLFYFSARQKSARAISSSVKINEQTAALIKKEFAPYGDDVEFRVVDSGDARAISIDEKNYCLINSIQLSGLSGSEQEAREKSMFGVAHELSHLISRDVDDMMRASMLSIYALSSGITVFGLMLLGNLSFDLRTILLFVYLSSVYILQIYWIIRLREFYADKISGIIYNPDKVQNVLTDAARISKFINYSLFYKLTHPSIERRLAIYTNFEKVYDYNLSSVLNTSFVFSGLVVLLPISFLALGSAVNLKNAGPGSLFAVIPGFALVISAIYAQFNIAFQDIMPSAALGILKLKSVLLRFVQFTIATAISLEIILSLVERAEAARIFSSLVPFSNIVGMLLFLLITSLVYFKMAQDVARRAASKHSLKAISTYLLWIGALVASSLELTFQGVFLSPAYITNATDFSAFAMVCVVCLFPAAIAYPIWISILNRKFKRDNVVILRQPEFKHQEWQYRHTALKQTCRPNIFLRAGIIIVAFSLGAFVFTLLGSALEPDTATYDLNNKDSVMQLTMDHMSRDAEFILLWCIQFVVIWYSSRKKGGLFPSVKRVAVIPLIDEK